MIPRPLAALVARFWELVESDSVRPFVWLYYLPLLAWGIFGTFVFPPVVIIESVMGHGFYVFWVWMMIPGTVAPMIGLAMRHGGSSVEAMTSPLLFRDWLGLVLQTGGHAAMSALLMAFEVSAVRGAIDRATADGTYAGLTIFAAFALSSYVVGTFLLSLQCLRKLYKGELLKRAAERSVRP